MSDSFCHWGCKSFALAFKIAHWSISCLHCYNSVLIISLIHLFFLFFESFLHIHSWNHYFGPIVVERKEDPNANVQINEVYSVTKESQAVCRSLVDRVDGGCRTGEQLSQAETLYSQQSGRGEWAAPAETLCTTDSVQKENTRYPGSRILLKTECLSMKWINY